MTFKTLEHPENFSIIRTKDIMENPFIGKDGRDYYSIEALVEANRLYNKDRFSGHEPSLSRPTQETDRIPQSPLQEHIEYMITGKRYGKGFLERTTSIPDYLRNQNGSLALSVALAMMDKSDDKKDSFDKRSRLLGEYFRYHAPNHLPLRSIPKSTSVSPGYAGNIFPNKSHLIFLMFVKYLSLILLNQTNHKK